MKTFKSLVLIFVLLFLSACSNKDKFEHKTVSYQNESGYKLEFTVKNVEFKEITQGETTYDCIDFEIEIKNLMTKPQAPFKIKSDNFNFSFNKPQEIKENIMYQVDNSMQINSLSISAEETTIVHYQVIYSTLNKNKDYVLKLCDTRI